MDIKYFIWLAVLGFLLSGMAWATYLATTQTRIVIVSSSPQLYRKWAITDAFLKASKLKGIMKVKKIETHKNKFGWYCVLWVVTDGKDRGHGGDFIPTTSILTEGT
jgi:hypothetical protein